LGQVWVVKTSRGTGTCTNDQNTFIFFRSRYGIRALPTFYDHCNKGHHKHVVEGTECELVNQDLQPIAGVTFLFYKWTGNEMLAKLLTVMGTLFGHHNMAPILDQSALLSPNVPS